MFLAGAAAQRSPEQPEQKLNRATNPDSPKDSKKFYFRWKAITGMAINKNDIEQTAFKIDLKSEMKQFRTDLIKWMFVFWFTLVLLILATCF